MRILISSFLVSFFVTVILSELISYLGIRLLIREYSIKIKQYLSVFYFILGICVFCLLFFSFSDPSAIRSSQNYSFTFFVISVSVLYLIPIAIFAIMTILSYLVRWLIGLQAQLLILASSALISLGILLVIAYGIFFGKYDVTVDRQNLYLNDLPQQLDGLKIVQISDLHLGTFASNTDVIRSMTEIGIKENPDILVFTGDIVNNLSTEIVGFESYLKQLPGKFGKFAVQGNHDYGDYSEWPDSVSKRKNLELIRLGLTDAGFELLLNKWTRLKIKDTSIYIVGVENWGHKPFPQYSRLENAMNGIPENCFKILLTHDPAHWEAQVKEKTYIPLTLAGHTHGGQFGIKLAGIQFSPLYFYQKLWGGMYKFNNQYIYVNKGLGAVGFPGRIEMRPEVSVLTLYRAKNH